MILPYLDQYGFSEQGDALKGTLLTEAGTRSEITTAPLHASDWNQNMAAGYVGTTCPMKGVQYYELGQPRVNIGESSLQLPSIPSLTIPTPNNIPSTGSVTNGVTTAALWVTGASVAWLAAQTMSHHLTVQVFWV